MWYSLQRYPLTPQSKKAHIEEIRSDAESLKKMKQQQKQLSKVFIISIVVHYYIHCSAKCSSQNVGAI